MLILTRKPGESITIGDDIKIQVIEIKGKQARLGIDAPKNYVIHREEIYVRIQEENKHCLDNPQVSLNDITDYFKQKR